MTFDLDSAIQLDSATLELVHPATGAPLNVFFDLAGPEHEVRKQRLFALMRRRRAEFEKQGKLLTSDPADDAVDELDMLAACTLGWHNVIAGGTTVVFSADACRKLYGDKQRAWIRDQVKAALDRRELFIGDSATA